MSGLPGFIGPQGLAISAGGCKHRATCLWTIHLELAFTNIGPLKNTNEKKQKNSDGPIIQGCRYGFYTKHITKTPHLPWHWTIIIGLNCIMGLQLSTTGGQVWLQFAEYCHSATSHLCFTLEQKSTHTHTGGGVCHRSLAFNDQVLHKCRQLKIIQKHLKKKKDLSVTVCGFTSDMSL